jgi:hypothetical protein
MMRALLVVLCLSVLAARADAAERSLDRWFDRDLLPYLTSTLITHPRFKGESVMFVVFEDNVPAPVSNALAISLRDRLLEAALDEPGIIVGRRQGGAASSPGVQFVDCTHDDVHYYIGISLSRRIDGSHGVSVRALDLEDSSWVSGFGKTWRGTLSGIEQRAVREVRSDGTFRGARDVPFAADESDLLAAHLAHELSCALLRETGARYIVAEDAAPGSGDELTATVQLVGNNLARHDALELTADEQQVNATLSGAAHRIDGALYQYWLTVTPTDPGAELTTLSSSAYVLLPGYRLAAEPEPERPASEMLVVTSLPATVAIPHGGGDALLGPLRILKSQDQRTCALSGNTSMRTTTYGESQPQCSVLIADARADAIVFVLVHQANYGLVRLGGPECRERTAPHVVTRGSPMRYPVPFSAIGSSEMRETAEWRIEPGIDTYYAFAVSNARAGREFANHIDALPLRCSRSLRRGLENNALHRWLEEFAVLAERHAPHVSWRAIQIKDVL